MFRCWGWGRGWVRLGVEVGVGVGLGLGLGSGLGSGLGFEPQARAPSLRTPEGLLLSDARFTRSSTRDAHLLGVRVGLG